MTALLASVRDLAEADAVVAAGCDWLDLKEPRAGALGAVPLTVVREVHARFQGRLPISATIGDCWDTPVEIPSRVAAVGATGIGFVKVGLFAHSLSAPFEQALAAAVQCTPALLAVCFAEDPPDAAQIARLADLGLRGVMLDTARKSAGSLRSLLSAARIGQFVAAARSAHLMVGLAGSLREADIADLLPHAPDYLGFRGALCHARRREDTIDPAAVRRVRALLVPATEPPDGPLRPAALSTALQSQGVPHGVA